MVACAFLFISLYLFFFFSLKSSFIQIISTTSEYNKKNKTEQVRAKYIFIALRSFELCKPEKKRNETRSSCGFSNI